MDFKYFGDEYLSFHDFLNSMTVEETIEAELNTHAGFILPNELAYYIGSKKHLMNTIKCVREIKKEPDKHKHNDILKKYNLNPIDVTPKSYIR